MGRISVGSCVRKGLEILTPASPILSQRVAAPITFPLAPGLEAKILETGNTLRGDLGFYTNKSLGLAAPQVGILSRFFVMRVFNQKGPTLKVRYVLNPRIVKFEPTMREVEEVCLSLPDKLFDVSRHVTVHVEYNDLCGKSVKRVLTGFESYVFQHEYDHLDGIHLEKKVTDPKKVHPADDYLKYMAQLKGKG